MVGLMEERFGVSHFYFSGVPFPFERYEFDSKICLRKGDKEMCIACIAVEGKDPSDFEKAQQTILEIATIYALMTNFSFHIENRGGSSIASLGELGSPKHPHIKASLKVLYPQEKFREYSAKLSANWERTKDVWKIAQNRYFG